LQNTLLSLSVWLLITACTWAGFACTREGEQRAGTAARPGGDDSDVAMAGQYINPEDSLPHIRYADGSVSINDRCPVRRVRLNPRLDPLYVNGLPLGFC